MSRDPTSPRRMPEAARPDRREETRLLVGTQDDGDARGRLLERLEQRGLGVLVHPVGGLDDRHARAALDRHEDEVGEEVLDAPLARLRAADHDLAPRPGRPEAMDVGVRAVLDQPARRGTPGTAGRPAPRCTGGRRRGRVRGSSCRRPRARPGARRAGPARDHRRHRGERGRLAPGPRPVHPRSLPDQAGSVAAVFRGARRFGGASVAAVSAEVAASAAAFGFRVARGLAAAVGAAAARRSPSPSTAVAAAAVEAPTSRDAAGFLVGATAWPAPPRRPHPSRPAAAGGRRPGLARGARLGHRLLVDDDGRRQVLGGRVARTGRRPARGGLLGDLRPEHGLELGRNVAPRLARAAGAAAPG